MAKSDTRRLDQLLVERGLAPSRTRAQALVLAGKVVVDDHRVDKPGTRVRPNASVRLKGPDHPFVSRGGVKLAGALDDFGIKVGGLCALDTGASTGGFTDCLLQRGAVRVYALDVGRGQLHERLRQDERVRVSDGINARAIPPGLLPEQVDLAVLDLSFISLKLVLGPVAAQVRPGGRLLALVKPQFEAGRDRVGKGGIVRDPAVRHQAVATVAAHAASIGLTESGRTPSRLPGTDGNQEFFLLLDKPEEQDSG